MPAILVGGGILVFMLIGVAVMIARFYRKVDQGRALIINKMRAEPEVTFTGGTVLPIIHRAEIMDISVKTIELDRKGHDGLICADNIRADIKVTFFVRVNKTTDDVLKVAQSLGCARASEQTTLEELFVAKFSEALKTVGKRMEFEQLYTQRDEFKDRIIEVIGTDLNGYVLDDAAIDYLEQTPIGALDPQNILDARGIRKITMITAEQAVSTNELRQKERMELTRQNLEADEAILELERRRADAEAKQHREIATVKSREEAETATVAASERQRSELARIKADEEIQIGQLTMDRQVQVADKDRERVVAIKSEQVLRDRAMEEIRREREVELTRIEKEKALEIERKEIAEVVRTRVAVDKGVAEEEERIKDLRVHAEASRHKDVKVVAAEADAQEGLIRATVAAEASEKASEFAAKERVVLAQAELQAADIEAKAKIRLAEGIQAEEAASGLALVRIKEANAVALEKEGLAEAKVTRAKMDAEAEGNQKVGLAAAQVTREKAQADADGIQSKADAMKALEGQGWAHEEFRLKLENFRVLREQELVIKREIAEAHARVLGAAMENADIKIVGGDGSFFDQFIKAVSLGQSVDGFVDNSDTVQTAFGGYLEGGNDFGKDLKDVLTTGNPVGTAKDVGIARLLHQLAGGNDEAVAALMSKAQELGLTTKA